MLGAEQTGRAHLSGGFAEGWEAPALNALAKGPVDWTRAAFYDYLRTGHSRDHGSAAGPMADVVSVLAPLPDTDIRAMASYLASLNDTADRSAETTMQAQSTIAASEAAAAKAAMISPRGARIFSGACASCHTGTSILSALSLNTNMHSDTPDNILQVILHGVEAPAILAETTGRAAAEVMSMPAFRDVLDEKQIEDLAVYLRARFAPDKPAWDGVGSAMQRVTSATH